MPPRWNENRLTAKLGIDYPIIQGPLGGLSSQRLTAAVSNFGGLGSFGALKLDARSDQRRDRGDSLPYIEAFRNELVGIAWKTRARDGLMKAHSTGALLQLPAISPSLGSASSNI